MSSLFWKRSAPGALLIAGLVGSAQAEVLLSNLDEPERAYNYLGIVDWAAQGFYPGEFTRTLESIDAIVGGETDISLAFAELRAADENGNMIETFDGILTTFIVPDLTGSRSVRTFIPNTTVELQPGMQYYFVMGAYATGHFEWSYAQGNGQVGMGFFGQYEYSFNAGLSWTNFGTDNPFHMRVNVVSVPPAACEGDADRDGDRDFSDITAVLTFWGSAYEPGSAGLGDADDNGEVNFADITNVLSFFAIPCP